MADEQNFEEQPQMDGEEAPAAEAPAPEAPEAAPAPAPEAKPKRGTWFALNLLFVVLAVIGIFSYAAEHPVPWILGAGLLGWGLLDFASQRKTLPAWKGSVAVWMNVLNILRALSFAILGALLVLQSFGSMPAFSANTLLLTAACFLSAYLISAYALELTTHSTEFLPHALLLSALTLQFLSFFCFSLPFTVTWAALFSAASFGAAFWAAWRGVLKAPASLSMSVMLAVLILGAPFATFFVEEVFLIEQQPVYQASIFLPRFYKMEKGLDRTAGGLAWAPGDTATAAAGEIPYSSKLAYMDKKDGQRMLDVYEMKESGAELAACPLDADSGPAWWAPDAQKLMVTGIDAKSHKGVLSILHWDERPNTAIGAHGGMQAVMTRSVLRGEDVMPALAHGQVWSADASTVFYSGPNSSRRKGKARISSGRIQGASYSLSLSKLTTLPSKIYPAVAPDGSKVLYVADKENQKYIEIGEGESGADPRRFAFAKEQGIFPAWNHEQTQVIFVDDSGVLKIMSANNKSDAETLGYDNLHSRQWKSENGKPFTLAKQETGERRQVWTMNPDGSGKKMIYESVCLEILPPIWSPDSQRISLIERSNGRSAVLTLARDGSWPRKFFVTDDQLRGLSWSQDSSHLAWFADRDEGKHDELWTVERDSSNPQLAYSSKGTLGSLTWSPEGQHLGFEERWNFSLWGIRLVRPDLYSVKVLDLKDHQARNITVGGLFASQPAFSPQGVMLAFLTEQNRWSLMPSAKRPLSLVAARLF